MKRIIVVAAMLTALSPLYAQRLDVSGQLAVRRAKQTQQTTRGGGERNAMVALVRLNDDCAAEDLQGDGFEVTPLRHGFATVVCEPDDAERLATHRAVRRCEFNRKRSFTMDKARTSTGVDLLQSGGLDLPQAYTGKGVVTGIVDAGFDPNHINFRDEEGKSRFKYFATVGTNVAGTSVLVTPYNEAAMATYSTDDNTVTHGTHTLGIMAGGYSGEGRVAVLSDDGQTANVVTTNVPFNGVVTQSDIYASTGTDYDAFIANAVDGMLQYRWYNARDAVGNMEPMVINLSLGGNEGPHDGSGALTQYLDEVADYDGVTVCLSSGNEGDLPISYHQTFTADNQQFQTLIRPFVYSNIRYGSVEIYSDTDEPFELYAIIYNSTRGRVALKQACPTGGNVQYLCSSDYQQDDSDIIDATFTKAYTGYLGMGSDVDAPVSEGGSGRFYAMIDYYLVNNDDTNPATDVTTEAQYTMGFLVVGKEGQRVDVFCNGTFTALDSYGYEGFVDGMRNGSISDMATGRKTIAVGSYNTREYAGSLMGYSLGYDGYYKNNHVTEFSSFGTLVDGRNLPHLLAPGCMIVSSVSTPYVNQTSNGVTEAYLCANVPEDDRNNYYYPMQGTSMSSPFVAGTVALMLEADPTLQVEEIREILTQTAVKDEYTALVEDQAQVGAGKLNAYEALKEVLRRSDAIHSIAAADSRLVLQATGNRTFNAFLPGAATMEASLYSVNGAKLRTATAKGDEVTIDARSLTPGVYVINVNGHSQRVIVK